MADTFPTLDAADLDVLYDELGESITYGGVAKTAILNISYQQVGRDAMAIEDRRTFNVRYSEVSTPARGDSIVYDGDTFTVDSVLRIDALEFVAVTS